MVNTTDDTLTDIASLGVQVVVSELSDSFSFHKFVTPL